MYDLAIIGSGPAGATLARLVGTRLRVLLVDQRRLDAPPGGIGKCCGGLLAPNAQRALAAMGLAVPHAILADPQLFTVRTLDIDNACERHYQRFYLNCDRELFDRWLVGLLPAQVDARFGSRLTALRADAHGVELCLRAGKSAYTAHARLVVGADGANSLVRRLACPSPPPRFYLACQEWYASPLAPPYFSALFDRRITDFYAWAIPKGDHLIIGAPLTPRNRPAEKMARLRAQLTEYGVPLGTLVKREGALLYRPQQLDQICPGMGRVALIGEAAGWISPSSGEGISYAFRSALALADALHEDLPGAIARYTRLTSALRRDIALRLARSTGMYTPWLRGLILRSGVTGMQIREQAQRLQQGAPC